MLVLLLATLKQSVKVGCTSFWLLCLRLQSIHVVEVKDRQERGLVLLGSLTSLLKLWLHFNGLSVIID